MKLQEEFDVARVTAREAMGAIRDRGLITTKPGKGSMVSPQ
ncbi:GntR family transcriptional regulator [Nonomuraea sp. NPDC046802]